MLKDNKNALLHIYRVLGEMPKFTDSSSLSDLIKHVFSGDYL